MKKSSCEKANVAPEERGPITSAGRPRNTRPGAPLEKKFGAVDSGRGYHPKPPRPIQLFRIPTSQVQGPLLGGLPRFRSIAVCFPMSAFCESGKRFKKELKGDFPTSKGPSASGGQKPLSAGPGEKTGWKGAGSRKNEHKKKQPADRKLPSEASGMTRKVRLAFRPTWPRP